MTVQEIAERLNGTVEGDGSIEIQALASLQEARPGDLSFLHSDKYARQMQETKASAVLVSEQWVSPTTAKALIRVSDPNGAFATAAPWFAPPEPVRKPGIHPTAVIAENAKIGAEVYIGPWTVVEDGAVIGDGSVIEAQVFIGQHVHVGKACHIYPQVTIREGCVMGDRCILHCGGRIGGDGYGFNPVFQPDGFPVCHFHPSFFIRGIASVAAAAAILIAKPGAVCKLVLIVAFMFFTGPAVTHLVAGAETETHDGCGRECREEDRR